MKSLRTNTGVRQRPTEHDQQEASPMFDEGSQAKEDIVMVTRMLESHMKLRSSPPCAREVRRMQKAESRKNRWTKDSNEQRTIASTCGFRTGSNLCVIKHTSSRGVQIQRRIFVSSQAASIVASLGRQRWSDSITTLLATSRRRRSDSGQAKKKAKFISKD